LQFCALFSTADTIMAKATTAKLSEATANGEAPTGKREAIVEAAARMFLTAGYGPASMDAIAADAGVSKQTVYSHFGAKDALFEAIVEDKCRDLMGPVRLPAVTDGDPAKTLGDLGHRFVATVFASPNMALFRVVIAESARFPELAEAFYRAGPAAAADNLAGYLTEFDRKGILAIRDAKASARLFFAMLRGDIYIRRLLDLKPEPSAADKEALVAQAVAAFLAAHAPN
jgi:TetR/AcrR family transcriptional regulator, mexJK operon transcriptional repressor